MGPLGAGRTACASSWLLLEIVSRRKTELFGTGAQILFVRSRFRHYQLELVACRCLSASRVPSMLWDGGARQDGSVVLPLDRGLTGVGSTENTSYVLTSDGGRWGDAQIFPRQTFVHFCHHSSPLALHLWEPSWLVWSCGYDPSDLRSDSSGFCLAAR